MTPTPDEICERLRLHRYALPDGFYSDEDYGCNEDNPCSLIMSILDSGPQGEEVMQELTACGYSIVKTEDTDNAADLIQQQQATIERLSAEKVELLNDIAVMMSEFVDNWPQPKKVSTALALIAKTLRTALGKDAK